MKTANRNKILIIVGLFLANALAFAATAHFFSDKSTSGTNTKVNSVNYFRKGWQVVSLGFPCLSI